ncbi:fungal STAND NTPase-like protein [Microdochium nivale]|nr:fungal STAND NTPase-like protein [Microdochium nivale]
MDPFSTAASVVGVIAVALQAAKKVLEAVERYKGRDKAMAQLSTELAELVAILGAAGDAASLDPAGLILIRGPIEHCTKICCEFKDALGAFNKRSQMPLKDWARMEFKRGTLKDFTDTLASYKCTLQIGLGTIVMRTTKQTHSVLEGYNELVQDTIYNLDMQLQRIHERIGSLGVGPSPDPKATIDLDDEKAVTEQCLRICQQAKTVLERFQEEQPTLQQTETGPSSTTGPGASRFHDQFQAQILTQKAMTESQLPLAETISRLQQRLVILLNAGSLDKDKERLRLQEDIEMSRQCLEVCNLASSISSQKIHIVGEVVADEDCDQVVVTTLADLFDVKKVMAGKNSAQLVGSMADATLLKLSTDRYTSRFGSVPTSITLQPNSRDAAHIEFAAKPPVSSDPYTAGRRKMPPTPEAETEGRPSANEIRRRRQDGNNEYR